MQLISAIVRPRKAAEICNAVQAFGFQGMTITDALGFGKQRGHSEIYRGVETSSQFQHQSRIDIVSHDDDVRDLVEVICKVAATGRDGDGK
ncbi:MAG: transcriptional regulator, partial [Frankiales bacterium]|nr:transcriptional regulator [Frankiales bacterium]